MGWLAPCVSNYGQESPPPVYKNIDAAIKARQQGIGGLSYESAEILCNRGVKDVSGGVTWSADPRLRYTSMLRFSDEHARAFLQALNGFP